MFGMSESLLKREFQEKDIQRARNILTGNYGNSTQVLVGYEQSGREHKEGDVWQQDGKTWTIEDGIKVSVSKLSRARYLSKIPLVCPKCGKPLGGKLDTKFYPLYGMCYDCVVRFEDDLKRAGLYKAYEQQVVRGNIESFVEELKDRLNQYSTATVETVAENGDVESWGRLNEEVLNSLNEWTDILLDKTKV